MEIRHDVVFVKPNQFPCVHHSSGMLAGLYIYVLTMGSGEIDKVHDRRSIRESNDVALGSSTVNSKGLHEFIILKS